MLEQDEIAVGILRRQPHFQIVSFARAEAHVAGAQQHLAVRQVQQLQHFFRVAGQLFQGIHRIFRTNDLHHFNLVELVHADQTAGVTAVRTGFSTEAWRVCGHFQRQRFLFHDPSRTRLVSGTSAVGISA